MGASEEKGKARDNSCRWGVPFEIWVPVAYFVAGALWIYFSDRILALVVPGPPEITRWSIYKGWFYVITTAILLFLVLRRIFVRIRQTQRQLEENDEYLRNVLDFAPIAMIIGHLDGTIEFVNRKFINTFGYTRQDVPRVEAWARLVYTDEDYRNETMTAWNRAVDAAIRRNGEITPMEVRMTCKDGSLRIVRIHASVIHDKLVGVFDDITDRKRAEDALHESERRFRNIVQASPMGIYLYQLEPDDRLVLIDSNPAADRLTNIDTRVLHGRTIEEAFPGLAGTEVPGRYRVVAREGTPWQITEFKYQDKNIHGAFDVHAFQTSPGRMAVMFTDVTSRIAAEAEIRELNRTLEDRVRQRTAQLEVANKELEAFSYSVSHDLRAPLRAINGFSSILLQEAETLSDKSRDYLNRIVKASQRMAEMIEAILQLSRMSRAEIRARDVDLTGLATEVVAELRERDPQRNVNIAIQPGLSVHADPALLRVVLENLLGNAWKFTRRRERAEIQLGVREMDRQWVFYLRDNGAGFAAESADKIFAAFQRSHSQEEFEGMGIGLATVQRIIHRHGGRIWAEGEVHKGASFFFTLPAHSDWDKVNNVTLRGKSTI